MPVYYEYSCKECGAHIVSHLRLDSEILSKYAHTADSDLIYNGPHNGPPLDVCSGQIKRCWSAGFVWPKEERGH